MSWFEDWFDENYLEVYGHRNEQDAFKQVELIIKMMNPPKTSKILDLGCGKGRHANIFYKKGYKNILGIDLSKKLITIGKKDYPTISLKVADASLYKKLDHYDFILSLFTSWGYYQKDEENSLILKNVYENLKKGGIFWLDFINARLVYATLKTKKDNFFKTAGGREVFESKSIIGNRVEKKIVIIFNNKKYHYRESLRLFDLEEIKNIVKKLGFEIIKKWGDYQGGPYEKEISLRLILALKK